MFTVQHLRCLASFFASCGLEEDGDSNPLLTDLRCRIHLNAMASPQLLLEYYHTLADCMVSVSTLLPRTSPPPLPSPAPPFLFWQPLLE